jgi:predicted nucleotidyltransferase
MLKYFITSKTKRKLLKLFLMNPNESYYAREIEKLIHEPINAVRRELGYLKKAGFLKVKRDGNRKLFRVNNGFPFISELKTIIYSTIGIGDYIKEHIETIENIEFAFIYGSVAKDEETATSDIDIFLVGKISEKKFHKIISDLEERIGRDINYTLMSKQEFEKRRKEDDPFIKRILNENKIILKGNPIVD